MLGRSTEELTLKLQTRIKDKFTVETAIVNNKKLYLIKHKHSNWSYLCKTVKEARKESYEYFVNWRKK